jgi:hypothetical protein
LNLVQNSTLRLNFLRTGRDAIRVVLGPVGGAPRYADV